MTAHKHAAMIKAKADNMDLVVLRKHYEGDWIEVADQDEIAIKQNCTYFLCLPQHKEACSHWLNGGDIQDFYEGEWDTIGRFNGCKWECSCAMMDAEDDYRIKPRKEKRWVGYCANTNQTFPHPQTTKEVAEDYAARNYGYEMSKWQFVEIEVEV